MSDKLNLFDYCTDMDDQGIILSFKGTISQEILADVGVNLRTKFESHNISRKTFAIFVELAQNIYHHSAEKEFSIIKGRLAGAGVIIVQDGENHLNLISGNLIDNSVKKGLLERCHYINSLDEAALREYFKTQRRNKKPDGSTGANIGLIDMARRSGNALEFDISEVNDTNSFFSLSIKVDKE